MPRPILLTLALAAALAPGALALGGPDPAATHVARVLEVELRWLGAQPGFHRHRHSVAELAAVREALRRALLFAHPDREVVDRVLAGISVDLDETPTELGARLAARARALGPHGVSRWGEVAAIASRTFARYPSSQPGTMGRQLRTGRSEPILPAGFDFTQAPPPAVRVTPAWMRDPEAPSTGLTDLPSPPRTGDPAMDLLAAEVLASLAEDVTSQAQAPRGLVYRSQESP